MNRADIEAMLDIVRQHLRGPAPRMSAFRIAHELETALTEATSARGSTEPHTRDTDWEKKWATTAEAATTLRISERWARSMAPHLGGAKRFGRWWIPRDSLPEGETT